MPTPSPLPLSWFQRPALEVAPDLMGQFLCRRDPHGQIIKKRITEVEAYIGPEDTACHAHRGKTERNRIMYDPGGNWYVYLCYGIHWLLNITTVNKRVRVAFSHFPVTVVWAFTSRVTACFSGLFAFIPKRAHVTIGKAPCPSRTTVRACGIGIGIECIFHHKRHKIYAAPITPYCNNSFQYKYLAIWVDK